MKNNISIIIPAYNCEHFIERCLQSLVDQSESNYEVIIVNDGSTDKTEHICNKFINKCKLKNFRLITQENQGVSAARNRGLTEATGEYITFIDADDYVSNDFIKQIITKAFGNDFTVYNFYEDNGNKIIENDYFDIIKENKTETLIINLLTPKIAKKISGFQINSIRNVWGKVYKKNIIEKHKILFNKNLKYFEDGLFNLEYLQKSKTIEIVNECIYYYYTCAVNSATNKQHKGIFLENEEKIKLTSNLIEKYNSKKINDSFGIFKFDLLMSYLKKDLFHSSNKNTKIAKRNELKNKLQTENKINYLNNVKFDYLNLKKKLIYFLIKLNLFTILTIMLDTINKKEKKG